MCLGMIARPDHLTVRPNPARRWVGGATASAVARRAKTEGGSDTHQLHVVEVMGFARLNAPQRRRHRNPGDGDTHVAARGVPEIISGGGWRLEHDRCTVDGAG